ncbi:MAG: hypothetical protein ACLT4C_07395 [Butyricicoccus sp.]
MKAKSRLIRHRHRRIQLVAKRPGTVVYATSSRRHCVIEVTQSSGEPL